MHMYILHIIYMLKRLRQRGNLYDWTFQTFFFVWTTNTKNQQTKPSYIYNTTTTQNTSKESIATVNEIAGIKSSTDHSWL